MAAQYFKNLRSTEGTVTLTAQWSAVSYGIEYDLAGGNFGTYHPDSAEFDETVIISNPTQEGYEFGGWKEENLSTATAKYGSSEQTEISWQNSSATVSSEYFTNLQQGAETVTLYATWRSSTYTVVFDGNGATSGSMANQTFTYGLYQNLTANAFSRTGHTFMGWATNSTATTPDYIDGQSVRNLTTGSTVTLYAVWDANEYTLYFDANGGTVSPSNITVTYGKPYGYHNGGELPISKRLGYLLSGWQITSASSIDLLGWRVASDIYEFDESVTLVAEWNETWYHYRTEPEGSGTVSDPYIIETPRNLGWLTNRVANGDTRARYAVCKQVANLNLLIPPRTGALIKEWYPIGTEQYPFSGTYYGNGYSIDILLNGDSVSVKTAQYQEYTGLFGYISNATITGLYLMTNKPDGERYTGGVAGYAYGSTIESCALFTQEFADNTTTRGAIIGYGSYSTIRNCTVFEATTSYGSLGLASGNVTIENCVYVINGRKGYTGSNFSGFVFIDNMKAPLPVGVSWLAEGGVPASLSTVRSWANS